MKQRIVKNMDILSSMRFDGSYHNADINIYDSVLKKHSNNKLSFYCSEIFTSGRNRRLYTTEQFGVPFLSNSDVIAAEPLSSCKYTSKKYGYDERAILKKGMILTGRVGAIGQTAFVPGYLEEAKAHGSDNIIRIVVKPEYKNGFIYAYLASKIGNLTFWKLATGGVQPFITDTMVGEIPIPDFPESFQKEVDDLIQESATLREEATSSLRIAISLFEKENVDHFINNTSSKQKTVSISNIINNHKRLDSTYQLWLSDLSNYNQSVGQRRTCKIQVLAKDIFIGNRGKRNYTEQGIPFISSSDMMLFNPIKYAKKIGVKTPNLSSMLVKQGDILISRSGTVGNTALVSNTLLDYAVSEHAMRLRIAEGEITPEYIFCYFNTNEGKRYLENLAYGSVIITLGEEFVGDIDLPILSDDVQKEITKLIKDYSKKIDTAIELENKATSLIELEIEKWNK